MTSCSSCGAELKPDAISCADCGAAVTPASDETRATAKPADSGAASVKGSRFSRRAIWMSAAVLIVIVAAVLAIVVFSGSGTTKPGKWASVTSGSFHTLAIKKDGSLWAWGSNGSGQLGVGDVNDRAKPTRVGKDSDWAAIAGGAGFTVALKKDGSLWGWGYNGNGQLGLGDTKDRHTPTRVGSAKDWAVIAAGANDTLALKKNGSLWACGLDGNGQLGVGGDTSDRHSLVRVPDK